MNPHTAHVRSHNAQTSHPACNVLGMALVCVLSIASTACLPAQTAAPPHTAATPTPRQQLQHSRARWETVQKAWGHQYRYRVRWQSAFGFGHTTTIKVQNGRVVQRSYEAWRYSGQPPRAQVERHWTETSVTASPNRKDGAAPALTIDALYDLCEQQLARMATPHEKLYLVFDGQGLLQACFTVNTTIADDAPRQGVPGIELLPPDQGHHSLQRLYQPHETQSTNQPEGKATASQS